MKRGWIGRLVWWGLLLLAALGAWHWLGRVDYPRQPTAGVPSAPATGVVNEADLAMEEGRQWGRSRGAVSHMECDSRFGADLRALGCHNQVTANKAIPALVPWNTHPTTRACVAAVHAHYDPWLQDLVERGNHHAAAVNSRRHLDPDVRECQNVDKGRILRDVYEPLERLNAILANLQQGRSLSGEEVDLLRRDIPVVEEFRPDPMRSSYLEAAERLFLLVGGRERIFPLASNGAVDQDRCTELAGRAEGMRADFHALMATAAQDAARKPGTEESPDIRDRRNKALAAWTQAATERSLMGCPPWR